MLNPGGFVNTLLPKTYSVVEMFIKWDAHWYTYVAQQGYDGLTWFRKVPIRNSVTMRYNRHFFCENFYKSKEQPPCASNVLVLTKTRQRMVFLYHDGTAKHGQ
jgi:hypothetical protein